MTNQELESRLQELTRKEREITHEILRLIQAAGERRLYLERGYPSLLDWLVKCYHYSAPAAYRRIQAAKLLSSVAERTEERSPGSKGESSFYEKVKSGTLTVSALSKVQSFIKAEEKRSGAQVSVEVKTEILKKVENQSIQETEKLLFQSFPEAAKSFQFEKISALSATESKVSLVLDEKSLSDLKRVQELLGHALPESSLSEVVAYLSKEFLKRKDPLLKKNVQAGSFAGAKSSPQRFRGAYQKGDGHPSDQTGDPYLSDPDLKGDGPLSNIGLSKIRKKDQKKESPKSALKSAAVLRGGEENRPRRTAGRSMETAESKILPQRKVLSAPLRRFIIQRDQGKCQFRDPRTGKICGSQRQIEIDHIQPVALGGKDRAENLRCLCRNHNQWRWQNGF